MTSPGSPESDHPTESPRWYARTPEEALREVKGRPEGLSTAEAVRRRERFGLNELRIARPVPAWRLLWGQVKSLVVALLFAAAGIALAIGDWLEAAAILAVLAINISLGFWIEWRARRAMEGLRRLQLQEAVVLRDGEARRVDARELVPGDVIQLEAGAAIPADARLLVASELTVVEAPLTGESLPVAKSAQAVGTGADGEEVPLAERTSMVYKGTLTAAGTGRAVVVATGRATQVGEISELVGATEDEDTPLEQRLDALGRRLVWATLAVAAMVTGVGLLRGQELWRMIETGIALAIAAVPEGLPVVATITLAVGMVRMARRNALVRRLPAVETLGSATVICTDKTGTLTSGEMMVTTLWVGGRELSVTGHGYHPEGEIRVDGRGAGEEEVPGLTDLLTVAALANRAAVRWVEDDWKAEGDPTEAALLVAAGKAGLEREALRQSWPEAGELPFDSDRMWMATFHRASDGSGIVCVKGAPRRLWELADRWLGPDGEAPLDETARERLATVNRELAGRGLRVLSFARRDLEPSEAPGEAAVERLLFLGFAGLMDPPAPGVGETIERLRHAGVRTVMITGDQSVTAEAVARSLGVLEPGEELLDGRALSAMSAEELASRVGRIGTFSRVSPRDKLSIVEALQSRGEIVGMLGDGVNDAPALKKADIGVAMGGRGTDVAKETAAVVLADDRFSTVAVAVEQGRVIFDNIRKFIFYLFSCNLSEVLVLFVAGLAGLPQPLLPLQILWLNLLTDVFPALALALEPAEPDVMERPPRNPEAAILSRDFSLSILSYGGWLTAATLGVFLWALYGWRVDTRHAVTLAFMTLALTQLAHVFNARSFGPLPWRRVFTNGWVWAALGLTVVMQIAAIYLPVLSRVLDTHPLGLEDWGLVVGASLLPLVVGQVGRRWVRGARAASVS